MKKDIKESVVSFLNSGTQLIGNIESEDDLCIQGYFCGTINSCKKLIIGVTGKIEGDITSPLIMVFGSVQGNIFSSGSVSLKETSKVEGTIKTSQLEMEAGAEFNGDCQIEQSLYV